MSFRRKLPSVYGEYPVDGYFLAPGGRFLLLSGGDDSLSLWDLGYNRNDLVKPYAVAAVEGFGEIIAVAQSLGGEALIIATKGR